MYLVLIETSGNQAFIFSTNKLRENVGASEATYRACSQWVLEAVQPITQQTLWNENAERLRANLLNPSLNPPIEATADHLVEVLVAASGKAMLLVRQFDHAQQIIQRVTLKALQVAPGLDVCGAIEAFDWNGDRTLPAVSRRLHQQFEVVRSLRPSPDLRFLRLPIVAECQTSGLPAATVEQDPDGRPVLRSAASQRKREWATKALDRRLPQLLANTAFQFASSSDKILDEEAETNWLAVIHADGNGLGQIFINLEQHIGGDRANPRHYIQQFREFSLDLDACTRRAFLAALEVFPAQLRQPLPLLPLVLGGDDLTVVCDARYAFGFTQRFLTTFEQETQRSPVIAAIAARAFSLAPGKLSACAGIAIVKAHFPFSTAYQLAEELTQSAKIVKERVKTAEQPIPCSAIDYHVLYDTRGTNLDTIRAKHTFSGEKTQLYNRPYLVSDLDPILQQIGDASAPLRHWLKSHHCTELAQRIQALLHRDEDGRRSLPNSQMHTLRESLFMGKAGADGQYALIRKRYEPQGITQIAAADHPETLFWLDAFTDHHVTGLLDAMDLADFWPIASAPSLETTTEEP
jgi:hypothetical protein